MAMTSNQALRQKPVVRFFEFLLLLVAGILLGGGCSSRIAQRPFHLPIILPYSQSRVILSAFPWVSSIPDYIYTHYVLPTQITQEPDQHSRVYLFETLAPMVANATSMREAAGIVNAWCYDHAGFRTTQRWDQGVRSTLRRGFGRCEEAVILFASALRSVGIPAREAGAPYWQHVNDNHVWVEAWLDGVWTPMEAGNPYIQLTGNVRKAPLVYTAVMGNMTAWPEPVFKKGPGYTILNVTGAYLPTWTLAIQVEDGPGNPAPGARVYASIYNYGSFRPIASTKCGAMGNGTIVFGPASLLLTVARDNRTDFEFVDWDPRYLNATRTVRLDISRNRTPRGRHFMPFMTEGANWLAALNPWNATHQAEMQAKRDEADIRRDARFKGWAQLGERFAAQVPWTGTQWSGLARILANARGNAGEVMRGLLESPVENHAAVQAYLRGMEEKDLVDVTMENILDVSLSLKARERRELAGETYDNATFAEFVLADRIEYEPFSRWRPEFTERMGRIGAKGTRERALAVNRLVADMPEDPRGFFGPLMTPAQVLEEGRATTHREKGILAAALLRADGIPARWLEEQGWAEFMDHGQWTPFFVDHPEALGDRNATSESATHYAPPGGLFLQFLRDKKPLPQKDVQYFRDFSVSRFNDETGTFWSLEKSLRGQYDESGQGYALLLAPGRYWVIAGSRNARGEPTVIFEPVEITSEKIVHMTVDVSH